MNGWGPSIVLLGLSLGLGIFTFHYAQGFSYLSTNPKACANCHVMQEHYDSWQKSSHHAVATCADCHMPHSFFSKYWVKAENGFLHSLKFTLQNYKNPIQIRESSLKVLNASCLHCHEDLVDAIEGHTSRSVDLELRSCTRCHFSVGH